MQDNGYAIQFAEFYEFPPETMVGETVFDGEGNAIGWIVNATAGEEHEMHICKRCGVAYELNIIDKGFGKPRFCPNCGYRRLYQ